MGFGFGFGFGLFVVVRLKESGGESGEGIKNLFIFSEKK